MHMSLTARLSKVPSRMRRTAIVGLGRAMTKLNARTRAQLVATAVRAGITV